MVPLSALFIIVGIISFFAGSIVTYIYLKNILKGKILSEESERILKEAKEEAERIKKNTILQAKEEIYRLRSEVEREVRERRHDLQNWERKLSSKEESIEKRLESIERREAELNRREKAVLLQERKCEEMIGEYRRRLEEVAGMTSEDAKRIIIESMKEDARHDAAKLIKQIEDEAREVADKKAKKIISLAIQRYAGEYVAEKTVSVIPLPNEEMKGRIIGREGRNIRAIEALTGVDIIIDDTPEAVIISCFDPIRREIARISLERLISDGRIHPARIEEIVANVQQEMENTIKDAGEALVFETGLHGIHPELVKLLGKLKFRSSYGQNVYQHSKEVAFLTGIMASELGLNPKHAKRAGLLHDIGKAVDHEMEGPHALIGAELARKYGESVKIVHAIAAHHEDEKPLTILPLLVQAADALSGARPGARRETLESYVKRLEELEAIARSFPGVEKCYAIQAGRELRVFVESDKVSDEEAVLLSKDIAKRIEKELTYPGQIKVTVIRETRAIEIAK